MLIQYDPDRYTVDVQIHTCPFHVEFPGDDYAGCTCSSAYTQRECTPEERADKRRGRLEAEAERAKRRARFFGT